jgi:hypothetical protein
MTATETGWSNWKVYHDQQLKQTVQLISAFVSNLDYMGEIEKNLQSVEK